MKYLLDTNACVGLLRGSSPRVAEQLRRTKPTEVVLCSIVVAELLFGALKSARKTENLRAVRTFTSRFASLPFDDQAALHYARVRVELEAAGRLIEPNDLIIASTALASGLTLVTHNVSEFGRVAGLHVEDWER